MWDQSRDQWQQIVIRAAHIPNIISMLRIASVPVLLVLAWQYERQWFGWLVTAALISDILDGAIARGFGFVSRLGMLLDSTADLLLFFVSVFGLWRLFPEVVHEHARVLLVTILVWLGTDLAGFLRYGRLAAFHTYGARITAYIVGTFFVALFLWGFQPWLFWTAIVFIIGCHVEVLIMLALLPEWSPDTPGLWRALRKRRAG